MLKWTSSRNLGTCQGKCYFCEKNGSSWGGGILNVFQSQKIRSGISRNYGLSNRYLWVCPLLASYILPEHVCVLTKKFWLYENLALAMTITTRRPANSGIFSASQLYWETVEKKQSAFFIFSFSTIFSRIELNFVLKKICLLKNWHLSLWENVASKLENAVFF